MPVQVDSFEVETYQIWQYHYAGNARPYIQLESEALSHGIRTRAHISFGEPTQGQVRFPQGFEGVRINSYLDFNQYQSIYSILQAEDPVYYHYMYDQPSGDIRGKTVPLIVFWLATQRELTGEGLENTPQILSPLRRMLQDEETPDEVIDSITEELPEDLVEILAGTDEETT